MYLPTCGLCAMKNSPCISSVTSRLRRASRDSLGSDEGIYLSHQTSYGSSYTKTQQPRHSAQSQVFFHLVSLSALPERTGLQAGDRPFTGSYYDRTGGWKGPLEVSRSNQLLGAGLPKQVSAAVALRSQLLNPSRMEVSLHPALMQVPVLLGPRFSEIHRMQPSALT